MMPVGAMPLLKDGAVLTQQAGILGTGITLPSLLLGCLNLLIGGVLVAFIKALPRLREATFKQRATSEVRMQKRIDRLEKRMDIMNAHYEAETAILRHALNNRTACLESLLRLLKFNPDRVKEVLTEIEADHARNIENERVESSRIRAAQLAAVASLDAEDKAASLEASEGRE